MKPTTTIGSIPYKSASAAVDMVFKYTSIPAWPQLPKRSFRENMVVQYSEGFPGVVMDEKLQKILVNTENTLSKLENFYERYLAKDIDYFAISGECAKGFLRFLLRLKMCKIIPAVVKCQTVGAITYAMMLKDENERSIFFNDQMRDAAVKNIAMKSLWQIKEICATGISPCDVFLFLDEPYLSAYGSAFTALSREEVIVTIKETVEEIRANLGTISGSQINLKIGIHCCGNTDWSLLLASPIEILSFDAYGYFEGLFLYVDKLREFISKKGILAWGIVPTNAESIQKETSESLKNLLEHQIEELVKRGIGKEVLLEQMLITPSCGLGSLSEESAEKALNYTKAVSEFF